MVPPHHGWKHASNRADSELTEKAYIHRGKNKVRILHAYGLDSRNGMGGDVTKVQSGLSGVPNIDGIAGCTPRPHPLQSAPVRVRVPSTGKRGGNYKSRTLTARDGHGTYRMRVAGSSNPANGRTPSGRRYLDKET